MSDLLQCGQAATWLRSRRLTNHGEGSAAGSVPHSRSLARGTNVHRDRYWYRAARNGLATVSIGLMLASCIVLFRLAHGSVLGAIIVASCLVMLRWLPGIPTVGVLGLGVLIATGARATGLASMLAM